MKRTAKSRPETPPKPFPVIGIGASAGGLEAVTDLLHALPKDTGMAFVLVQHLDPKHESMLSSLLAKTSPIPVVEVRDGMAVQPDKVFVIPPNTEMQLEDGRLRLRPRPTEARRHTPIDVFFGSLANERESQAIGVILSGVASDGVNGLGAIKEAGGITFAQEPSTAKFPEMPRQAADAGYVDLVLPPAEIAREISRIKAHPYVAVPVPEPAEPASGTAFARILGFLRKASRVDFSLYKVATVRRRIQRRMALLKFENVDAYSKFLPDHPEEVQALYNDILIKVTDFFRDPPAFTALRKTILPAILKGRTRHLPVRIWVPGCATGEEAFSIAMILVESLGSLTSVPCQIFATDLSDPAIEKARAGIFPESAMGNVSPERLRRFFIKVEGGYQISKMIRDLCVFARQDLIKDPPFSRLDLISCRNVLIYMDAAVHRRLIPLFHYALKPGGFLLLGASESIGSYAHLFQQVDKRNKIFLRRSSATPPTFDIPIGHMPEREEEQKPTHPVDSGPRESDLQREIDRYILHRFAPSGVVVDRDFEIVQFRGQTRDYLQPASGKASLNLLRMAREGLLHELRQALQRAVKKGEPVRTNPIAMGPDHPTGSVVIEVIPLSGGNRRDPQYLVLFGEHSDVPVARRPEKSKGKPGKLELQIQQLRQELFATKEHLQSIIEEQETTNEELKSANEEILSSNEELQSTNEELETAKEELQSTNEELTTLNEELQNRNTELSTINNDMLNLLASVNLPILMVGNDLRIRRFTPASEKLFNLIAADVGRPVTDLKPAFELKDFGQIILESIENVASVEREVRDAHGRWHMLRVRPYRTRENRIDGAVIVLLDVDERKRAAEAGAVAEAILDGVSESVLVLDGQGRVRRASAAVLKALRLKKEEVEGKRPWDVGFDSPEFRSLVERLVSGADETATGETKARHRAYSVRGRRVDQNGGPLVLLVLDEKR